MVRFLLSQFLRNQRDDLVLLEAQPEHGLQKRLDMPLGKAPLRLVNHGVVLRHKSSRGPLAVHQAVPLQLRQGPLHGVGVHPGLCGQVPHRGQSFPRGERAGNDAHLDLLDQLGINGGVVGKLPLHLAHLLFLCCCLMQLIQ